MYIQGDRQQNSHVLKNEVINYLLMDRKKSEIAVRLISELLGTLLLRYYSWFDCESLDKQIEHFELYKEGKVDTPVDLTGWC